MDMNGVPIPMTKKRPQNFDVCFPKRHLIIPNLNVSKAQKPNPSKPIVIGTSSGTALMLSLGGSGMTMAAAANVVRSFWVVSAPFCGTFSGFKSHLLRCPYLFLVGVLFFLRFHFNIPMKIVDLGNIAKHQVKQGNQNHHLQKESKLLPFFFGYSPLWVLSPRQHIVPSTKTRFFVK